MKNINKLIDHTLLKPEATSDQIDKLIQEAREFDFASVMVNSSYVKQCAQSLKDSDVKVATVIGFPLGACTTQTKLAEVKQALEDGANEFDMVLNIGWLKEGKLQEVTQEIQALRIAIPQDMKLKVIIETCLLSEQDKINACECVSLGNADFIKTSTGFSTGGATVEDVALLREYVNEEVEVKASGGVRTYEDLVRMVEAGATRIGTSNGVALMEGKTFQASY